MSFEREVVEKEIERLEVEKAQLMGLQREHSTGARLRHQQDHDKAIAALESAKAKASEKARSVLQTRIDELRANRDAVEVKDFGAQISDLSMTIGQLRDLLEQL